MVRGGHSGKEKKRNCVHYNIKISKNLFHALSLCVGSENYTHKGLRPSIFSCLPKRVKSDMFVVRILQLVGLQMLSIIIIVFGEYNESKMNPIVY